MKYIILIMFLSADILYSAQIYQHADSINNHEIIFSLDKYTYQVNEDIILKIQFDFNKGDSIVYFSPHYIISDIVYTSSTGTKFRPNEYLGSLRRLDSTGTLVTIGSIFYPEDSILPHQCKILTVNLNKDFSPEDSFWGPEEYQTEFIYPGTYTLKFEAHLTSSWLFREVTSNELKFKVLPKTKIN